MKQQPTYEVQLCRRLPDGSLTVQVCEDDPDLVNLVARRMLLLRRRKARRLFGGDEEFERFLQEEDGDE